MVRVGAVLKLLKFGWGWAFDKSTIKVVFGTLLGLQVFLNLTFPLIMETKHLYRIWIWLFILIDGGNAVLIPNILRRLFGASATLMSGLFYSS